ncbi:MAG: NADH-quinone oxidoreductase subunit H [Rickettsiales bacterium]|nr:MAG: NADH-quinone oxidoreductase subunit H [Rickettsiales bacterium]
MVLETLKILIISLVVLLPVLLSVAYLTLIDRKIMAAVQLRKGPNVVGLGLLQPFADALKLAVKEAIIPVKSNKIMFVFAPSYSLWINLSAWSVIPFDKSTVTHQSLSVMIVLALTSLAVYGLIISGWASNSRYAFLGSLRSAAQMISYEVVLGLLILLVCLFSQSFNLIDINEAQESVWFIVPLIPWFFIYLIAVVAETNRTPFDLPEAEAELVAGYNVEYSSLPFAAFFIAEYGSYLMWSHLTVIYFWGGWSSWPTASLGYCLKLSFMIFFFSWARATYPRYRWDQLMYLTWRYLLPMTLASVFLLTLIFAITAIK